MFEPWAIMCAVEGHAMAESVRLRVEVEGDDIVVLMPGTQFRATYQRDLNAQRLVVRSWRNSPGSGMSQEDFLARAWRVASTRPASSDGSAPAPCKAGGFVS
jgi:hypothetical protein